MTRSFVIVGIQMCVVEGVCRASINANLARSAELIRTAARAELYFLPELAAVGYSHAVFAAMPKTLGDNSQPEQCFIHNFYKNLAAEVNAHIGFSMPIYCTKTQRYVIAFVVVNPTGDVIYRYDKLHLCQYGDGIEKEYFVAGQRPLASFSINGIRISAIICYDQRFAELPRLLVDSVGADVIVHPCAFARDDSFPSWHAFAVTRALENQVYFLSLNFAGSAFGDSIFVPPWIDFEIKPNVLGTEEGAIAIEIDLEAVIAARQTYPFKQDARPLSPLVSSVNDEHQ